MSLLAAFALLALALWWPQKERAFEAVVAAPGQKITAIDGDSFRIGPRELRLRGMDAPEYRQNCKDKNGADWPCGKAARAGLETLLLQPGLACDAEISDKYRRQLAICRTNTTADIAAAQVASGLAVSHDFKGLRDYGEEEDTARKAGRGIWQGAFTHPREWRDAGRGR